MSHAPGDLFPYLGRRRGRDAVLGACAEIHDKLEIMSSWPMTTLVEGNQAALTVVIEVRHRTTDRLANFLAANFFAISRRAHYRLLRHR
ncbi:hypothetical protein ACFQX9_34445 [Bradyrhizobium sp. GCM10028915]|uniref:hypothetical protein n=1 Tax=Bradyrhizobium sp. GCM10028915 TaxID=3273385 RepID=UPI003623BF12